MNRLQKITRGLLKELQEVLPFLTVKTKEILLSSTGGLGLILFGITGILNPNTWIQPILLNIASFVIAIFFITAILIKIAKKEPDDEMAIENKRKARNKGIQMFFIVLMALFIIMESISVYLFSIAFGLFVLTDCIAFLYYERQGV